MDNQDRSLLSQMKNARATQTLFALGNGIVTQIVPQSSERVSLIIYHGRFGASSVSFGTAPSDACPFILNNGVPISLTKSEHGNLVDGPWFAQGAGQAGQICVWEVFNCPCQS